MMEIPLDEFEDYIDARILDRGLSLYYGSFVHDPTLLSEGEYEFIVEGGNDYSVYIQLEDRKIVDYACDCPYDHGPICKHVTAALYHLEENPLVGVEDLRSASTGARKRPQSASEQMNAIFGRASKEDLQHFIQEQAEQNPAFRSTFLLAFSHLGNMKDKEQYSKQVKKLVNSFSSGQFGFIDWREAAELSRAIYAILESAEKFIESGDERSAYHIFTAVWEELTANMEFINDADRNIGELLENTEYALQKLAQKDLSEDLRKDFFDYCLSEFDRRKFRYSDSEYQLLLIASKLLTDEKEREKLQKRVQRLDHFNLDEEAVQELIYRIHLKMDGEKAAFDYMEQHPENVNFRQNLIEAAIEDQDYNKAKSLAGEAAEEEKHHPFRATTWIKWLLTIAEIEKDTSSIIKHAKRLFYSGWSSNLDYYQLLKDTISPDKWSEYVEEMIEEIKSSTSLKNTGLLSEVYIQEEYWDRLMEEVRKDPSLFELESYEEYLGESYSSEFIEMYREGVLDYLEDHVGRKYYQTACGFLRRMIRLGGEKEARETIAILRKTYTRRPALLEELNRV